MRKKILTKKEYDIIAKDMVSLKVGGSVEYPNFEFGGYLLNYTAFYGGTLLLSVIEIYSDTNDLRLVAKMQIKDFLNFEYDKLYSKFNAFFEEEVEERIEKVQKEPVETPAISTSALSLINKPLLERAEIITTAIYNRLNVVGLAQLEIALFLKTAYEDELFKQFDYKNIYDYASDKFGIARGTVSNWIMVATNFGIFDGQTGMYTLDKRLSDYSITQLILLRSLTVEQIQKEGFKPSMSCREVKEKVKSLDIHVTKDAGIEHNQDCDSVDEYTEEEEGLYSDCEKVQETQEEQKAKISFTVKGGTSIMDTQISILNKMIQDNPNNVFEIKVFVRG